MGKPPRLIKNPIYSSAILLASIVAFLVAYWYIGWLGFMAGAIVGEGPGIAEEHAIRNQKVFGLIGGLWSAWIAGWFTRAYLKKRDSQSRSADGTNASPNAS